MANVNEGILKEGRIVGATKRPVITIGLGPVCELMDLTGIIWRDDRNKVVIVTKEAPEGCTYKEQDRTVVVRVIGGKIKINGLYDIYAPDKSKIQKLLSNRIDLEASLTADQLKELQPILDVASEVRPSIAPPEYGRKVIVITPEMVGEQGYIYCHCSWDPEDVLTKMYPGDVFVVEDKETCKGYCIRREEFGETHDLANPR